MLLTIFLHRWLVISFVGQAVVRRRAWPSSYRTGTGDAQLYRQRAASQIRSTTCEACEGEMSWPSFLAAWRFETAAAIGKYPSNWLGIAMEMRDLSTDRQTVRQSYISHVVCVLMDVSIIYLDGDELSGVINRRCPLVGDAPHSPIANCRSQMGWRAKMA